MLAAWYPLISNMNNQGLADSNLTVSSTPTFVSGLLGGALQGGGAGSWTSAQTASILNNTAMSFCFWVYPDAATGDTGARARFFGNDSPRHYSIFQYPTCNDLHWDWRNNAGSTVLGGVLSGVLPSYKWTHVTFTYQNPTFKIYINGVLKHTASASLDVQSYANATSVILACSGRKLCDYRVYTHCLSPKEVQLISRGLMVHYPMDGGGRGAENRFKASVAIGQSNCTTEGDSYLITLPSASGLSIFQSKNLVDNGVFSSADYGKTFTISYIAWADANTQLCGDIYPDTYGNSLGMPNDTSTINVSTTPKRLVYTGVLTNSTGALVSNTCLRLWHYGSSTSGHVNTNVYIKQIKIELGSVATPWIPHVNDTAYSAMGYNSTTEYDTSGYLHNGTINGSVSYSSDTARYSVSTNFSGSNNCWLKNFSLGNEWSYGIWFKYPSGSRNWENIIMLNNNGSDTDTQLSFWINTGSSKLQSTANTQYNSNITLPSVNVWHHFFATFDGSSLKTYIDGNLVDTKSITAGLLSRSNFSIGGRFNGTSSWTNYFTGQLSDFRLYATCLTAEDIQKLYNTSASIANNGVLMSYEFAET